MSKLRVHLLGGLRVFSTSGQQIAIPARKAQALLAYLARYPTRSQPRGKMAALLWEESSDVQARASLRQTLKVLRKALGAADEGLIAIAGDTIALSADCAVDAMIFERFVDDGTPEALEKATALYEGEFLEAFIPKAPAFEDWLMTERQRLRERAMDAVSRLLAFHIASGKADRAIEMAMRLLSLDPLQEHVHRSLMQLYAKQGREASALRQFQICREILRRELGENPEAETERLFQAIQRQRRGHPKLTMAEPGAGGEAGNTLQAAAAVLTAAPEGEATLASELRHVTIVFAEMLDLTRVGSERDPEQIRLLADRFLEIVGQVVEGHGGTVQSHIGGSAIAVFGMPAAHTNDPERALRAALQVQKAVRSRNESQPRFGVHLGIADGQVLVTDIGREGAGKATITGDVVNIAARLAAAANGVGILVSDTAYQALSHLADCAEQRFVSLQGSGEPVCVWQVSRLRAKPGLATQPSFVGRHAELRQFLGAIEACRETGRGLAIYVRGEAGIGKTRLVTEFQRMAIEHDFACHTGRVIDFGAGIERDAIRAIVSGLLRLSSEDEIAARTAIKTAVADGLLDKDHQVYLHDILQLSQPMDLRTLYDAMDPATRNRGKRETILGLVKRASAMQPIMMTLEDVHWADPPTLAHAAALAALVEDRPVLLVMTARTDGDPLNATWRAMTGGSALATMDLGPLRRQEAIELVTELTDETKSFNFSLIDRSGGNPLFLEQLLLHYGDSLGSGPLPASVQSVVLTRMDRLDAIDRQAVRAASVLGQLFSLGTLRHLIGDPRYECLGLLEHGLVRPEGDDYLFAHALVREGAYSSLPKSERRALHHRAAEWFADHDAILRAQHLEIAEHPAAPQAYLEAARSQATEYHYDRAVQLIDRGLALDETAERFALACYRGELLLNLGAIGDAQLAYEAALAVARDDGERCRAWLGLAAVKRITDDFGGAFENLKRAEEAAALFGLSAELARAHFLHGNLLFAQGDLDGCLREHQRSLTTAQQAGSAELEAEALGGLADAEYMRGRMLSAHDSFRSCIELCKQHGFGRIEVANRPMLASTRCFAGDTRGALDESIAAIDAAARVGHRRAELIARQTAYLCRYFLADLAPAQEDINCSLELARQLGAPRFEAAALAYRGELHRLAGRRSHALADIGDALTISGKTGMAYNGPTIWGILALAAEDSAMREKALSEGEALLASNAISHNHLLFRKDAIDACLAGGDWSGAERHAAALENFAHHEPLPWTAFFAARGRALAARGAGRNDGFLTTELQRLEMEGERLGLRIAVTAISRSF